MNVSRKAGELLAWVLIGALLMVGMRAVEYVWDRPATRLVICVADSDGTLTGVCKPLSDYLSSD